MTWRVLFYGCILGLILFCIVRFAVFPTSSCNVLRTETTEDGLVEIVTAGCSEGLPHTTDANTIRMTEDVWNSGRREEILRHERVHLSQKRRPDVWLSFYKDAWGYELFAVPPIRIPDSHSLRPNPDTAAHPYALWRGRWLFFPTYGPTRTLRDAPVRIWDIERSAFVPLPTEWRNEFCGSVGCPNQYEHPHELSAEILTLSSDCPASKRLREFFHTLQQ